MSLATYRTQLGNFGIVIRAAASSDHPALPAGDGAVILAIPIPAGQVAALEELDGADPSEEVLPTPPTGARLRRALRYLQRDDDVLAWALVREGTSAWVHLLVTRQQATQWYRWIDWTTSTRKPEAARPGHVFFGA
jgi:hypothetical protein